VRERLLAASAGTIVACTALLGLQQKPPGNVDSATPLIVYRTVASGTIGLSGEMLAVCRSGAVIHRKLRGFAVNVTRTTCEGPIHLAPEAVARLAATINEAGFERFQPTYGGRHWPYTEISLTSSIGGTTRRVELTSSRKEPPPPPGWGRIVAALDAIKVEFQKAEKVQSELHTVAGTLTVGDKDAAIATDRGERVLLVFDPPQTALSLETMLAKTAHGLRSLNGRQIRVKGHRQGEILWNAEIIEPRPNRDLP